MGSRDRAVIESLLGEVCEKAVTESRLGETCCVRGVDGGVLFLLLLVVVVLLLVLLLMLVFVVFDGCDERSGMTRVRRAGG